MAGGAQDDSDDMITQINVVPLVDIILVVLIIFMITANLIAKQSLKVELPEAATGEAAEPTTLALTLDEDGNLYLNGVPTAEPDLLAYLREVAATDSEAQAIIAAHKDRSHGEVVRLIDLIRQHGIYKFALNIEPVAAAAGTPGAPPAVGIPAGPEAPGAPGAPPAP